MGGFKIVLSVEVGEIIPENAHFYIDDESFHGFLIDPGAEAEKLLQIIAEKNFVIEKILLTHGHFDHIGAVTEIQNKLKIPVFAHELGKNYLFNPEKNLSIFTIGAEMKLGGVNFLADGDFICLEKNSELNLQLIHTPGHTTDGATFYSKKNNLAFVGDTIFKNSFGRTDFPGGNFETLIHSIKTKIFVMPDETILYTGHGENTSVGYEKNFFTFYSTFAK